MWGVWVIKVKETNFFSKMKKMTLIQDLLQWLEELVCCIFNFNHTVGDVIKCCKL